MLRNRTEHSLRAKETRHLGTWHPLKWREQDSNLRRGLRCPLEGHEPPVFDHFTIPQLRTPDSNREMGAYETPAVNHFASPHWLMLFNCQRSFTSQRGSGEGGIRTLGPANADRLLSRQMRKTRLLNLSSLCHHIVILLTEQSLKKSNAAGLHFPECCVIRTEKRIGFKR